MFYWETVGNKYKDNKYKDICHYKDGRRGEWKGLAAQVTMGLRLGKWGIKPWGDP